jgi:hypothetical protein
MSTPVVSDTLHITVRFCRHEKSLGFVSVDGGCRVGAWGSGCLAIERGRRKSFLIVRCRAVSWGSAGVCGVVPEVGVNWRGGMDYVSARCLGYRESLSACDFGIEGRSEVKY